MLWIEMLCMKREICKENTWVYKKSSKKKGTHLVNYRIWKIWMRVLTKRYQKKSMKETVSKLRLSCLKLQTQTTSSSTNSSKKLKLSITKLENWKSSNFEEEMKNLDWQWEKTNWSKKSKKLSMKDRKSICSFETKNRFKSSLTSSSEVIKWLRCLQTQSINCNCLDSNLDSREK